MQATAPLSSPVRSTHGRILMRLGAAAAAAGVLALAGVWDARSPRYWRALGQEAGLWAAQVALRHERLRVHVPEMVRRSLGLHRDGITPAEAALAASLLEDAGDVGSAATLHLGLAHQRHREGRQDLALSHARRADRLQPGETALLAVLLLHRQPAEGPGAWITQSSGALATSGMDAAWAQLRDRFPSHELVHARRCAAGVQDFAVPPPAACAAVGWLAEPAAHGRREHARLSADIESLPRRAAGFVAMAERQWVEWQQRREILRQQDLALAVERERLPARAIGQAVHGLLPLPKDGDTLESFVTREGLCSLPLLRVLCRGGELALAWDALRQGQQAIDTERARLAAQDGEAGRAMDDARSTIAYWQSSRPLDSLLAERARLLPAFRATAEQETGRRYDRVGLPLATALSQVLAAA